jgi:hypothetical protein
MLLLERPSSGGTVVISAVDGAAGIGKTAVALHLGAPGRRPVPRRAVVRVVAELRARGGIEALDGAELATELRAVFSCSYNGLSVDAARLFRLLGTHPGPGITAPAAASLAGTPTHQALRSMANHALMFQASAAVSM